MEAQQRQILWTARRRGPGTSLVHRQSERGHLGRITNQHVESGRKALHPMDKQGEMNGRFPREGVPWCRTLAQVTINPWHDASQHREKAADRNQGFAIERERASPPAYHLSSTWLIRVDARGIRTPVDQGLPLNTVVIQF